jgi:hypothetical protein
MKNVQLISTLHPQPTSLRSILIPSSYLCLSLPSGLFPLDFPTKTLHTFLSSPMRATCPAHLILLYLISLITFVDEYKNEGPHCAASSILHHLIPLRSNYSVVKWLTLVLRIREVSGLILSPGYPDRGFSWFLSVPPGKCQGSTLKLVYSHFLSNPFQVIIDAI